MLLLQISDLMVQYLQVTPATTTHMGPTAGTAAALLLVAELLEVVLLVLLLHTG